MQDINWDDLKIAYQVALHGSLSRAGERLNTSHTTLIRHISRLEENLGVTLFIRHQRGYRLTDAGQLLLETLPNVANSIGQVKNALLSVESHITGMIKITTLPEYSAFLHPVLKTCRDLYPQLQVQVNATDDIVPLSAGDTHVSIRAGSQPKTPDLIVKKLFDIQFAFYAADSYIQKFGLPEHQSAYIEHQWILPSGRKRSLNFIKQVNDCINDLNIVYQSNNFTDIESAIKEGIGIGPIDVQHAQKIDGIVQLPTEPVDGDNALWFIYHRDAKNNARIRALFQQLIEHINNIGLNSSAS